MDLENRVVVLIDMDCFYCQVEEKLNPDLKGKPIAVVQYNPWKGGGIIAVNYVARGMGVTRHMRGDEAKEKCPEIELPSVPCFRGKADISKYRDAGKEVARILQRFTPLLERASIDEAYLDITQPVLERLKTTNVSTLKPCMLPNTFCLGYDSLDQYITDIQNYGCDSIDFDYEHANKLLIGAVVVSEIREAVYQETGFTCSAGIAHNKILAKLVCGMNKPNKQTILPKHSINVLYRTLPIKKVKSLGGKFGYAVRDILKINSMAELQQFSERDLRSKFDEKNGTWLYNIARGVDLELVQARFNPKSIGCCKQLRGKSALKDIESLKKWLRDLGDEIEVRLEKDALENNRNPKQMVISYSVQLNEGRDVSSSRSYNFSDDDELCGELFASKAFEIIMDSTKSRHTTEARNDSLYAPISFLGISVGKFEDNSDSKKNKKILDYFSAGTSKNSFLKMKKEEGGKLNSPERNHGNSEKEYILQKFVQDSKPVCDIISTEVSVKTEQGLTDARSKSPIIEASNVKQESFFAKFLNGSKGNEPTKQKITEHVESMSIDNMKNKEDSNDTIYSASTIDAEINKSIALFEDDPQDIDKVVNTRKLLYNSTKFENYNEGSLNNDGSSTNGQNVLKESPIKLETIKCSECNKNIPVNMSETHSDFHFAVKLRNEEREILRSEKISTSNQKSENKSKKEPAKGHENLNSMFNFVFKLNDSITTEICLECNKRIPVTDFPEHLDFHEAQKLSRELNKKTLTINTEKSKKRKRKSKSPAKKLKVPCKSIESFFIGN